ncbi:response regulator [Rubellimicrobium rubrum]|uniref:Response regulator n=1 Tax=Rubellimicrobium rubrum TaxID=2585369 RepID=A0A5C4MUB8_9RHOB|nr:response regulator [Rubellimicrobium rubrum]TNC47699.1 response regulator [Rubellimicrobium rubrum]
MNPDQALAGRRILLVEDDFIIADDVAAAFGSAGAEVVGPAATPRKALELIKQTERLDGAMLDINLQGDLVYAVVDALQARGVPVIFASGYDRSAIPERYADIPFCEKPVDRARCAKDLFR